MAKAKKSEGAAEPAPKKEPAAKKAAAEGKGGAGKKASSAAGATAKKGAKADKAPAPAGRAPLAPPIDTGLAAQAAASMIANRAVTGSATAQPGDAPQQPAATPQESSAFKSLKEGLNKPPVGGLGSILGTGGGSRKTNQGFGGPRPSVPGGAKNQTFGADVNRAGVPRRTGG